MSSPRLLISLRTRAELVRLRRPAAVVAAALLGLTASFAAAAPAQAQESVGYVRLAHLSPDTPKVDVYLSKVGDASFTQQVFQHVGYGLMSKYLPLPVGTYAVAMRNENAPASEAPVLTTQVTVQDGGAYTVAGVGKFSGLGLKVLTDDLSRPVDGKAKVRIIQASVTAPVIDVDLGDGTSIAKGASFASTTDYRAVAPGSWTLKLKPNGTSVVTSLSCEMTAGSVYSLLVLDGANGLSLELRADARGGSDAPDGGVETGEGGTSPWHSAPIIAGGMFIALGLVLFAVRMRRLASRRS